MSLKEGDFKSLIVSMPDAMIVVDESGKIILVNNQVANLFGYVPDEIIGATIDVLIPKRYRDKHTKHIKGFFSNPHIRPMGTAGMKLHGLRKDQSEFAVEISLAPVTLSGQKCSVATIRDSSKTHEEHNFLRNRWKWLITCVIILHLFQGALLVLSETAGNTTSTYSIIELIPGSKLAGFIFIVAALLGTASLLVDRYTWLFGFQLLILVLSAIGAGEAIFYSRFADGVVRSRYFIAADQVVYIILAIMYMIVLLEIYLPRRSGGVRSFL